MYGLHESTTANLLDFFSFYVLQNTIPAVLLIATAKRSPLRYLAIPCMICIASRFIRPFAPAGSPAWCQAISQLIIVTLQATNVLLINPLDRHDLSRVVKGNTLVAYFFAALRVLVQIRGINTPWQVKNIPPQPRYYVRQGKLSMPRSRFLFRQSAILAWQYLALDIVQTTSIQQAPPPGTLSSTVVWNVSGSQWLERAGTHLSIWFVVNRIIGDSAYRLLSIISVGTNMESPSDWPPMFGRMADTYTLRNFWGKFWHQFLRQPFTSISNFIARDILSLRRSSLLERYTNIFIVFFCSAVFHVMVDMLQSLPMEYSGSIPFYLAFVLGIMLEDGVQALWRRFAGSDSEQASSHGAVPPAWHKVVGMAWTMTWLAITSTWYFTPVIQLTNPDMFMVPFSLAEITGLPIAVGAAVVSGLVLVRVFEIEL
ncbi:uncharacterized protein N7459_000288 [Penicillium hispanicum]|uniref:uncharacterized protein n=1 Tax=Penicillium hispanicum TaxID=1080232 RepID=UPI00253F6854|nr:uncharacterized protein N7459_000288 [Penicillium hispanicum]KAJ5594080.1 hypothetical protein N7459_000288 [Penicillium hispanicum]